MLIVDGHADPAYNQLVDGRDYLRSAFDTRAEEVGGPVEALNGVCMLGLPEWLAGGVGVVVSTLTAIPRVDARPGELGYTNAEGAWQAGMAQLAIHHQWAARDPRVVVVTGRPVLDVVVASWDGWHPGDPTPADPASDRRRVGFVLLIENADIIRDPAELDDWVARGVRMVGPAWAANRYAGATDDGGPLTPLGRDLVARMARLGVPLDVSHLSDAGIDEAMGLHDGLVVATHANPRRHVHLRRNLSDATIRHVASRRGVVGVMPLNWALGPGWSAHRDKACVALDRVVDAIAAVCDVTGDTAHVGIGSDFDGGQGAECVPDGLDTVADLGRVADRLSARGFADEDVVAVMSGNWLRVLRAALPTG